MFCLLNTKGQVASEDVAELAMNLNAEPNKNYFKGKLNNLRIFIKETGEYFIKGSIWKYETGNNTSSYSYPQFISTCNELDSLTFGTFSQSKVISYEFGLNIKTNYDPAHYLIPMIGSRNKNRNVSLNPEYKNDEMWIRRSPGLTHGFKCYNKSLECKMSTNMLRIEYCVKSPKRALGKVIGVADLKNTDFVTGQQEIIKSFSNSLVFHSSYDPSLLTNLKTQDKWRYLAYANSGINNPRAFLKSMGFNTTTRSYEYKKLMRIISGPIDHNRMKRELCEKVEKELYTMLP